MVFGTLRVTYKLARDHDKYIETNGNKLDG